MKITIEIPEREGSKAPIKELLIGTSNNSSNLDSDSASSVMEGNSIATVIEGVREEGEQRAENFLESLVPGNFFFLRLSAVIGWCVMLFFVADRLLWVIDLLRIWVRCSLSA